MKIQPIIQIQTCISELDFALDHWGYENTHLGLTDKKGSKSKINLTFVASQSYQVPIEAVSVFVFTECDGMNAYTKQ